MIAVEDNVSYDYVIQPLNKINRSIFELKLIMEKKMNNIILGIEAEYKAQMNSDKLLKGLLVHMMMVHR